MSAVFLRVIGSHTDFLKYPSLYALRTPLFTASGSGAPSKNTSLPISSSTTAMPVSWQTGITFSRAMLLFSISFPSANFAAPSSSAAYALSSALRQEAVRLTPALSAALYTASSTVLVSIVLISVTFRVYFNTFCGKSKTNNLLKCPIIV